MEKICQWNNRVRLHSRRSLEGPDLLESRVMGRGAHTVERTVKSSLWDVRTRTSILFSINVTAHVEEIKFRMLRLDIEVASFHAPSWKWHVF